MLAPPSPRLSCPSLSKASSCLFYTLKLQVHHDHQLPCQGDAIWSLARFQGGTVNYNLHDRLAKFPQAPPPQPGQSKSTRVCLMAFAPNDTRPHKGRFPRTALDRAAQTPFPGFRC